MDGSLVWKGYNGLIRDAGISHLADFENMHWDDQDRLQADAVVSKQKSVKVTLTEGKDGKREWLPHVEP